MNFNLPAIGGFSRTMYSKVRDTVGGRSLDAKPYVVVIFGHTGVGVSSLVNLIVGHLVSHDYPNSKASAREPKPRFYSRVTLPGSDKQFCLYEVPGFGGRLSDANTLKAIHKIDRNEGIDLFIRKQKMTVMPQIVRRIQQSAAGREVPMIAVVIELERFEAAGGMEDWWDAPIEGGRTNGLLLEERCLGEGDAFDAHACVTTLPPKDVDLVEKLRKRRDFSEERIQRLIQEQCAVTKRQGIVDL